MLRQQGSKSEIISSILRSTRNPAGAKVSQIQYETYISYNQLKDFLTMMIQNQLIVYFKEEKIFKITEHGMHVLKLYDEMDKLLDYNRVFSRSNNDAKAM
jgi:predicted transcriptional regulator